MAIALLNRISSASISRPAHDRQQFLAGADQFGIVLADGRGDHNHIGIAEITGAVAGKDIDALAAETLHIGAIGLIGALHPVAEIAKRLGDAAHPDAANSDEMHQADGFGKFHCGAPFLECLTSIASTRSASKPAASSLPMLFAARAISSQASGLCHRLRQQSGQMLP